VFKFALDEASLGAIKREITLFRILNDSLGGRAQIVRLLDWNLEEPPYFTEAEYMSGGSVADWANSRGGLAAIPLTERLEVVAKVASALAALHSVGVLHKDLKPSNIFVKPGAGQAVDIALGDFGSGAVFDPSHSDRLGITRLGFTKTVAPSVRNSATPPYAAPETLKGEPSTVKADIYALGVILYQLLTGDFYRILSPGWEHDIDDELLREDIALAAAENPAVRTADAEVLARRLRTLEERRAQLKTQREVQARADDTHRRLARTRLGRASSAVAVALLLAGFAISIGFYVKARRAEQSARIAAAQAEAVTRFLSDEVFSPRSNGADAATQATAFELLTRAGDAIDERFAGQPAVAAELHYLIGHSLARFHQYSSSAAHLNRAMQLGQALHGAAADPALRSAAELVAIDYVQGRLKDTLPAAQALGRRLTATDTSSPPSEFRGETELYLGQALIDLAKSADAATHLRRAVDILTRASGASDEKVVQARAALGRSLALAGRYDDAAAELARAQELAARTAAPDTWPALQPRYFLALLFLEQDLPDKAEPILAQILSSEEARAAASVQAHPSLPPEIDRTGPVRQALGEAYAREGKYNDAIATLQSAVAVSERTDGAHHPDTLSARVSLAECLATQGRDSDARAVLAASAADLAVLPAVHPIAAQLSRVNGLLAQHEGNADQARKWFAQSLAILQTLHGAQHWRVIRARRELERA
jgi:non-specific serine/threonine protein kinase